MFALPIRVLPPIYTTRLPLPRHSTPFALALRHSTLAAIAHTLRVPPGLLLHPSSDSATAIQLLLPATDSGIGHVCPALISPPAYLGGLADSLPLLLADHILFPALTDTSSWPTSPSISLRQAAVIFARITSLPTFATLSSLAITSSIPTRLQAPDGLFSLSLLHSLATHRPQHAFARATFSHLIASVLAVPYPNPTLARLRHNCSRHSTSLFTMYYVPSVTVLSPSQLQFLYLHRLGIPFPTIPVPHPPHCLPRCPTYPPNRPIPRDSPLLALLIHGIHAISCGLSGRRLRRHDALIQLIAAAIRAHVSGADVSTSARLCSSSRSGTKVDMVFTSYHLHPFITAVDPTVSCPLLPSHLAAAAASASTIFTTRAAEKDAKHLPGCVDLGRAFLAIVWTTYGGIGPPAACDWLDSIFAASYTAEYLSGGTGQDTSHRRLVFYQSLHAALVRGCADMVEHLTPTSANLAAAAAVSAAAATTTAHQPTTPAP